MPTNVRLIFCQSHASTRNNDIDIIISPTSWMMIIGGISSHWTETNWFIKHIWSGKLEMKFHVFVVIHQQRFKLLISVTHESLRISIAIHRMLCVCELFSFFYSPYCDSNVNFTMSVCMMLFKRIQFNNMLSKLGPVNSVVQTITGSKKRMVLSSKTGWTDSSKIMPP